MGMTNKDLSDIFNDAPVSWTGKLIYL